MHYILPFYVLACMSALNNCSLCLQRLLFFYIYILGFRYVEGLLK